MVFVDFKWPLEKNGFFWAAVYYIDSTVFLATSIGETIIVQNISTTFKGFLFPG